MIGDKGRNKGRNSAFMAHVTARTVSPTETSWNQSKIKPTSPLHTEGNQDPDPNFKLPELGNIGKMPNTNISETCHIPERGRSSTMEIWLLRIHRLSETFANHPTPVLERKAQSTGKSLLWKRQALLGV